MRAPVPAVNEPHYLAKARHFADSDWCRNDFFLASSNPHQVFYHLVGPLTRVLPLDAVAVTGRLLALVVLATGWVALVQRLVPDPWAGWSGTCLFLLAAALGNLSGEWIVGGFESKVLAYGLLLWSCVTAIDGRLVSAAFCGMAISLHPIIGGWGLGLALLAGRRAFDRRLLLQGCLVAGFALPGIIPALALLGQGTLQADNLQVFDRLGHHLVPSRFSSGAVLVYAVGLVTWLVVRRRAARTESEAWWTRLVLASLLVAVVGRILSLDSPAGGDGISRLGLVLMKFYPYRLFDVLLPAAGGVTVAGLLARYPTASPRIVFPALMLVVALVLPATDRNPSRLPADSYQDWLSTCDWIDQHLPNDAVVLTPSGSWAFKWYARRAEFVVRKDCPQDAAGILEWDRRRRVRGRWLHDLQRGRPVLPTTRAAFSSGEISHILWSRRNGPAVLQGLRVLHENRSYVVYAVAESAVTALAWRDYLPRRS